MAAAAVIHVDQEEIPNLRFRPSNSTKWMMKKKLLNWTGTTRNGAPQCTLCQCVIA